VRAISRRAAAIFSATTAALVVAGVPQQAAGQLVTFAPGTDLTYRQQIVDMVMARYERIERETGERFVIVADPRWADGNPPNFPIDITWSLFPDTPVLAGCNAPLPGAQGSPAEPAGPSVLFQTMDLIFGGNREAWLELVDDAFESTVFDSWGTLSGINFTKVTRAPITDPADPENIVTFDFDDGPSLVPGADPPVCFSDAGFPTSAWGDDGVLLGADPGRGDIRVAMKAIDGPGGVQAYAYPPNDPTFPGEIVLDSGENWANDVQFFRFFRNMIARQVGVAMGMGYSCVEIQNALMEPFPLETGDGPQLDDVRGIHTIYGDVLEPNNQREIGMTTELPFDPVVALLGESYDFTTLSIDPAEEDVLSFVIPELETVDIDVTVDLRPGAINGTTNPAYAAAPATGGPLPFTHDCAGVDTLDVNAGQLMDLKIGIFDIDDNPISDLTNLNGQPLPLDDDGFMNERDVGGVENGIFKITQSGTFFIVVAADGDILDAPELYDLSIDIGNVVFSDGVSYDAAVVLPSPFGINAAVFTDFPAGGVAPGNPVITGFESIVGIIDDRHPSTGHDSTRFKDGTEVPPVAQQFPPMRVGWPGNATSRAALMDPSEHATVVAAAAVGNPIGTLFSGHIGPAFEASIASASISTLLRGGGFLTNREAIAYALWALTDPDTAALAGLPATADIVANAWGIPGDQRGDGPTSLLYDAAVWMNRIPIVTAAGNFGLVDNTDTCGGAGGDTFGGPYFGGKTMVYPSTAWNDISAGAAARELVLEDDDGGPIDPTQLVPQFTPFDFVEGTSSKGPIDVFDFETGDITFQERNGIDILAPSSGYIIQAPDPQEQDPPDPPCTYTGHVPTVLASGPDFLPTDTDLDNPEQPERLGAVGGTSISAGMVAGGLALLIEFGKTQDPPFSTDPALIKALTTISGTRLRGWTDTGLPAKPQDNRDGREEFVEDANGDEVPNPALLQNGGTQTLDRAQGAGMLNLRLAYEVYRGQYLGAFDQAATNIQPGDEQTDIAITDPTVPTVTVPPNEIELIVPVTIGLGPSPLANDPGSPFTPQDLDGPDAIDQLPPSSMEIATKLRAAQAGTSWNSVARGMADTGDPDLADTSGEKSASGVTISPRPPFQLPDDPDIPIPGFVFPPKPFELTEPIRVNPIGWDRAMIGLDTFNMPPAEQAGFQGGPIRTGYIDYFIEYPFTGGDSFRCVLSWLRTVAIDPPDFSNIDDPQIGELTDLELENLDIQLINTDATGRIIDDHIFLPPVTEGNSLFEDGGAAVFETTEYMISGISPGFQTIRVSWTNRVYDLFNNNPEASTEYALVWRVEPGIFFNGPETAGPVSASSGPQPGEPHFFRVMRMFIDAFGTRQGDPDFAPHFDIDRNGAVDVYDFWPVASYWMHK
jgi:hypothetical protein